MANFHLRTGSVRRSASCAMSRTSVILEFVLRVWFWRLPAQMPLHAGEQLGWLPNRCLRRGNIGRFSSLRKSSSGVFVGLGGSSRAA